MAVLSYLFKGKYSQLFLKKQRKSNKIVSGVSVLRDKGFIIGRKDYSEAKLHTKLMNGSFLLLCTMKKYCCSECKCFKYCDSDGFGYCDKWEEADVNSEDEACVEFEEIDNELN